MPAITFASIASALPRLSVGELKEISTKTQALLALSGGKVSKPSLRDTGERDWLIDGVLKALEQTDSWKRSTPRSSRYIPDTYADNVKTARELQSRLSECYPDLTTSELAALGGIIGRVYLEYVRQFMPVSLNSAMRNLGKIPDAVETAFPDYMATGAMRFLIRHR